MQTVYDQLALPAACVLGKRAPKKPFIEHAETTAADRRAFVDDVDSITWQLTLKPGTLPVHAYRDSEREYLELAVIEVDLRAPGRAKRLAALIHRAIPYPVLLVLVHNAAFAISVAHKRWSQAERGAWVAEDCQTTHWINATDRTAIEQVFLQSLSLPHLPQADLYALYSGWHARVLALACARWSGAFHIPRGAEQAQARRERLAACHALETEIARLRAAIRQETRFNRQVELNIDIKRLENELRQAVAGL
jgi:hypothetical protein